MVAIAILGKEQISPPVCFWSKRAQFNERKDCDFRECKKTQKSAQEYEKKGIGMEIDDRVDAWI